MKSVVIGVEEWNVMSNHFNARAQEVLATRSALCAWEYWYKDGGSGHVAQDQVVIPEAGSTQVPFSNDRSATEILGAQVLAIESMLRSTGTEVNRLHNKIFVQLAETESLLSGSSEQAAALEALRDELEMVKERAVDSELRLTLFGGEIDTKLHGHNASMAGALEQAVCDLAGVVKKGKISKLGPPADLILATQLVPRRLLRLLHHVEALCRVVKPRLRLDLLFPRLPRVALLRPPAYDLLTTTAVILMTPSLTSSPLVTL